MSGPCCPGGDHNRRGVPCAVNQAATQPPETIEAHGRQPVGFLLAPALCPSVPFASRQERVCDRSSEERDEQAGKKESSAPLLLTPAGASRADFDRSPMRGAICGLLPQAGQILLGIGRRAAAVVTSVDRRFGNREHGGSPRRLSASPWQDALGGAGGNSSFAAGVAARKTIPRFFSPVGFSVAQGCLCRLLALAGGFLRCRCRTPWRPILAARRGRETNRAGRDALSTSDRPLELPRPRVSPHRAASR